MRIFCHGKSVEGERKSETEDLRSRAEKLHSLRGAHG